MDELFGQAVPILRLVLPGFLATFIFYWMSDAPKPSQFERIVQALMGTVAIQFCTECIKYAALWAGKYYEIGSWTGLSTGLCSVVLALFLGLTLAYLGNKDVLYSAGRKVGLTHRSAYRSDWHFAHRTLNDRSVVLQLLDGRRLAGYPRSWPSDTEKGHYLVQFPTWIVDNKFEPATGVSFMLISVVDVLWTEFLDPVED